MGHFIYTRSVTKQVKNTADKENDSTVSETLTFRESLNLNKVIRSVMRDTDTLIVLLDDGHEESIEVVPEDRDPKTMKVKREGVKKRLFLASEIELHGDDIGRFFEAISK